jgi:glycosyltransferase involved in cell wall biosynthesis
MRVAHLGNYKPGSANGVNQTIAALATHLPKHGIDVELWHFTDKVATVQERSVDGIKIIDLPAYSSRWRNTVFMKKATRNFLDEQARHVDLLHLHSVFMPENLWATALDVPYVLTPNGGYSNNVLTGRRRGLKSAWIRLWERDLWRRARLLHAVSPDEATDLAVLSSSTPVTFIPNGIDDDLLEASVPPASHGSYWLYLGRLAIDHKGLDLLLHGYRRAQDILGPKLPPLILAGPDFRNGREQLKDLIGMLDIGGSVSFAGPVYGEEKQKLLSGARCFVHTSRWEGMPFALLEAMALGRPVLITPGTNLCGYVEQYGAGWTVEATPESIGDGLVQVFNSAPDRAQAKAESARSLARNCFAWALLTGQMATAYREVICCEGRRN